MSITSILGSASGGSEVEAKAMIEQPDKSIIIGLSVDMSIDVETQKNATLIPVNRFSMRTASRMFISMTPIREPLRKRKLQLGSLTESVIRYFPAARQGIR